MSGNHGVGHAREALAGNRGDFQTIEILAADFRQHPFHSVSNIPCIRCAKECGPYRPREKEEVPARSMNLSIQREAIDSFNHAPVRGIRFTLNREMVSDLGKAFDQNGAGLNGLRQ